ncbi:MAG: lipoyl(octanoyl) transferase LipB [Nitrospirae bacterium]|nr:lipoyl(octanoyl) transferase LipB [Magnetococcales bacterium]HAT48979.1 hypothetical protein [Alphaproteobacteria bacterium]
MPNTSSMVQPPETTRPGIHLGTHPYDLLRPGRVDYSQALIMQQQRVETLIAHGGPNLLILLEHPPVYTVGRSGKAEEMIDPDFPQKNNIQILATDRGGRTTYHGPGQVVAYVIRDLRPNTGRVLDHVRRLEETVIGTLSGFGIQGTREQANPGVWVDGEKIAALGVRIRRGITYHGFALNHRCDLNHFSGIIPCGLQGRRVTSLAHLGVEISAATLERCLLATFAKVFDAHLTVIPSNSSIAPSPGKCA